MRHEDPRQVLKSTLLTKYGDILTFIIMRIIHGRAEI